MLSHPARPLGSGVLTTVGNTPLVSLDRLFPDNHFHLYAKLEMFNPGGSGKDRSAVSMVLGAYESGRIGPGATIIESSSGNLGVGLAQVCTYLGLRFICVVDTRTTPANLAILKAYGVEIELVESPDPMTGDLLTARINRVKQLCAEIPGSVWVNQYANEDNPKAHYRTMEEITAKLGGRVDYVFTATSTCGTLRGVSEYVRDHDMRTKVIGVDAVGSVIFGDAPGRRLIPGHGASRLPELYRPGLEHGRSKVTDWECVVGCFRLLRREAIFAGGSAGAVVMAVSKLRHEIPEGANCVVVLCDRGERYLETIYSEAWVNEHFGDLSPMWEDEHWAVPAGLTTT
jgi:2,3-diaminopropionate biosynthesis protein SbnA